jgi:hypothetical protein
MCIESNILKILIVNHVDHIVYIRLLNTILFDCDYLP